MKLELDTDFCNGFFYTLAEEKSRHSVCRINGRFSCVRSKRKSLLHKAPADFSTASGENSRADGANSGQNQGVSAVPTGAPVTPWRQGHRPMRACPTDAPARGGWRSRLQHTHQSVDTDQVSRASHDVLFQNDDAGINSSESPSSCVALASQTTRVQ